MFGLKPPISYKVSRSETPRSGDFCHNRWGKQPGHSRPRRTLSQMMTKEFLLISRGTKVSMYKAMFLDATDFLSACFSQFWLKNVKEDFVWLEVGVK